VGAQVSSEAKLERSQMLDCLAVLLEAVARLAADQVVVVYTARSRHMLRSQEVAGSSSAVADMARFAAVGNEYADYVEEGADIRYVAEEGDSHYSRSQGSLNPQSVLEEYMVEVHCCTALAGLYCSLAAVGSGLEGVHCYYSLDTDRCYCFSVDLDYSRRDLAVSRQHHRYLACSGGNRLRRSAVYDPAHLLV